MTPLGVKKHAGNPNLIFSKRKRFPDSGKASLLKRKVAKMRFLPIKFLEFNKSCISMRKFEKITFFAHFYPKRSRSLAKIAFYCIVYPSGSPYSRITFLGET
jgi:hypothetical protein